MNQGKLCMIEGSLGKEILLFSLPLMASNLLQVLFNMADIAVIGQFAGAMSLGAVGSTTILVALFTGLLIGISGGINVVVARFFGAGHPKDIEEAVHSSAVISLIAGLLLLLIGVVFTNPILNLLGTKPELIDGASTYLHIYFLGMPALALYNFGNAVFSAIGDTKRPLMYLSFAGVVNIVLNLFFVISCRMDVAGVALASIISQYLSALLILRALICCREVYGLRLSRLGLYPDKTKIILAVSIPSGIQNGTFQLANLFIQAGVNSFDAIMVAGNSAAANADNLVYDVMMAFYTACGSFMGQNYGAGKRDRVLKSFFVSLAYSLGIGLAMGFSLVAAGPLFLGIFTKEAAVVSAGMKRLTIMGMSYGFSALMDCPIAASRGLGKTFVPTIFVFFGSVVFRIIWVNTIFAYFGTITSLYLLYIFSWTLTAIAELLYFRHVYKATLVC